MVRTFSLIDFEDDFSPSRRKLFVFLQKLMPYEKKTIAYLPRMKRYKVCECRVPVCHYSLEDTLAELRSRIANANFRQRAHIPKWEAHIALLERKFL